MRKLYYLALVSLLALAGCQKEAETKEPIASVPTRILSAYVAMVENPTAVSVTLVGDESEAYREFFERAGLMVDTKGKGDIVFVAGALKASAKLVEPDGVMARTIDVRGKTMKDLAKELKKFPCRSAHLWMVGIDDWVLVGRKTPAAVKLSTVLDLFASDGGFEDLETAKCLGAEDIFANYVGDMADIAGVFDQEKKSLEPVRAQYVMTEKLAPISWIEVDEAMDPEVAKILSDGIRSRRNMRKMVIEGNILADDQKIEDATKLWAKASLGNPNDAMLLDRLDRLWKNADTFVKVGNFATAAKCYETYLMIRPNDWQSAEALSFCLQQLGKKSLSQQVHDKAMKLKELNEVK